jgi:branched-chain amino acid transport system ATP-binding protein
VPRLRCERVTKNFGSLCVLKSITLQLPDSGIVALIGPNGAGKSTLVNIITGFLSPDIGHCYIDDNRVTGWRPEQIARLGVRRSFQELRVFSDMTTIDNILVSCQTHREAQLRSVFRSNRQEGLKQTKQAEESLTRTGLMNKSSEIARTLSYGQQKLLSLCACAASGANVILLDEPVSGVDSETAQAVFRTLLELRNANKLVIFIEHDLIAVRRVADTVYVLGNGEIICQGEPENVLANRRTLELYLV